MLEGDGEPAYTSIVPAAAGAGRENLGTRIGAAAPLAIPARFLRPRSSMVGDVGRLNSLPVPIPGSHPSIVRHHPREKGLADSLSNRSPAMNPAFCRALRLSRRIPNSGPSRSSSVHAWAIALIAALNGARS